MEPNRKSSFMFIVNSMMALAFFFSSIDARMYYDSMNFHMLPKYTPIPPSEPSKGGHGQPPPHFTDIDFGMLPKGLVPPSGPSNLPTILTKKSLHFGMLPKYTPIPPSGPSKGGHSQPPPHFTDIDFGMLPKGLVPPSGPSNLPTILTKKSLHFGMLPKYTPIPPSGPSKGGHSQPPPHFTDIDFGMLPKGLVPPSGPRQGEPPLRFTNIDFGMLSKELVPPSGPSKPPTTLTKKKRSTFLHTNPSILLG